MNMKKSLMGLGAALAVSGGLAAQDVRNWDAGLNLVLPLQTLTAMTNQNGVSGGFTAELGFNGHLGNTTVPFRTSLSINDLPGKADDQGVKMSLMNYQLAGDLFTATGVKGLSIVTGLSANKWSLKYTDPSGSAAPATKGIKFGGRIGLEYAVSPAVTLSALVQLVEFGTDAQQIVSYNPSWIQVGAKYHF